MIVCRKPGCNLFAAKDRVYCCIEHSPLGLYGMSAEITARNKKAQHRKTPEEIVSGIRSLVGKMSRHEIADHLDIGLDTLSRYARTAGVSFPRGPYKKRGL